MNECVDVMHAIIRKEYCIRKKHKIGSFGQVFGHRPSSWCYRFYNFYELEVQAFWGGWISVQALHLCDRNRLVGRVPRVQHRWKQGDGVLAPLRPPRIEAALHFAAEVHYKTHSLDSRWQEKNWKIEFINFI